MITPTAAFPLPSAATSPGANTNTNTNTDTNTTGFDRPFYVLFRDSVDFHMFKVVDGEIRLIQAVVSAPGHTASGWEEQER